MLRYDVFNYIILLSLLGIKMIMCSFCMQPQHLFLNTINEVHKNSSLYFFLDD